MEWLNYHHLLYFWTVARHGSITSACRELKLRQPTISSQLKTFEDNLGVRLFKREGKKLVPTEQGNLVLRYAEQIFNTGRELVEVVKERSSASKIQLVVGIADVLPKRVAYKLIEPIFALKETHHLTCIENSPEQLLADLALHKLDVVLSDAPVPTHINIKAYSHLLGESSIALFASKNLLPATEFQHLTDLNNRPLLLPTPNTMLRRAIDQWLDERELRPTIVGEFDDSALLEIFGQSGKGIFPAPTVLETEIKQRYNVDKLCEIEGVKERFYALSLARQIRHPSVLAICNAAGTLLSQHGKKPPHEHKI
jgi:LysR family transcriptional activator of nhaA